MAARVAHWVAIVIGGAGGTLAALVGSGSAPAPAASVPVRAPRELSSQVQSALPAQTQASIAATLSSAGGSPALAPPASAASSTVPPALPPAELVPLPTTARALLLAEMRCDERKADFCVIAARSYETGSAGVVDREKAAKYRRIALTAWISQCDHNAPSACATLAMTYRSGSGVPQNERTADALVARARDLCRYRAVPACKELPPLTQ
jgi:TPR repeat protein